MNISKLLLLITKILIFDEKQSHSQLNGFRLRYKFNQKFKPLKLNLIRLKFILI